MKRLILLIIPAVIFTSCGGNKPDKAAELAKLKTERSALDVKIKELEANKSDSSKVVPVSVTVVQPIDFNSFIEVQSGIGGDEVVTAGAKVPSTIKSIRVQVGQRVHEGQLLAIMDASVVDQQMAAMEPQIELAKSLYEKQQKLWAQNIGTEVQLMSAKAQYDALLKNRSAMKAQRDMYNIVSPIDGTIDAVSAKVGDQVMPGFPSFRVVNLNRLKAEASLGENYLGKVHEGDPVTLVFPGINDSINTKLSYVAESVDPASRAFVVQVRLSGNKKLHPNMSCIMKISNYENKHALVVPVSVIQKTSGGLAVYIADGNVAKSVSVTTGRNSNGMVEVLTGLKPGDKVITTGYEEMDNGLKIAIQ